MNERLLQFLWECQYFNQAELSTESGDPLQIIFPGIYNTHQGPDFLTSRIVIGKEHWVGNIELHCKTSDWNLHDHSNDEHYNNVILHVVWEDDDVPGLLIPLLVLHERVPKWLLAKYTYWLANRHFVPCQGQLPEVEAIAWQAWRGQLVIQRLRRKAEYIGVLLQQANTHWEEVFWWMLARNFGMKVNADAFEQLARHLPEKILAKEKHQRLRIEALLFGQAGLLNEPLDDQYYLMLQNEFRFLRKKHGLHPGTHPIHFLRMRPSNFPTVRLAQLAMLISKSTQLFSTILGIDHLKSVREFFDVTANDYWHYHYRFGETTAYHPKQLGQVMINNIMINAVIPMVYAFAEHHGQDLLRTRAVQWLQECQREENSVIREWSMVSPLCSSAFDSQAMLELKSQYCDRRRCLDCDIGKQLMARPGW